MVKCVVKNCLSRSERDDKASGVTFHKVPKNQKRKEEWTRCIRLLRKETDWLPSPATVICSKHFRDQDKIPPKHDKGHTQLSVKAVPMVIVQPECLIKQQEEEGDITQASTSGVGSGSEACHYFDANDPAVKDGLHEEIIIKMECVSDVEIKKEPEDEQRATEHQQLEYSVMVYDNEPPQSADAVSCLSSSCSADILSEELKEDRRSLIQKVVEKNKIISNLMTQNEALIKRIEDLERELWEERRKHQ